MTQLAENIQRSSAQSLAFVKEFLANFRGGLRPGHEALGRQT